MEVADIFVVNKSDRPGADRLRNDVELMLGLRRGIGYGNVPAHHGVDLGRVNPARAARKAAADSDSTEWTPPVLRAVAAKDEGITDLVASLDRHFEYLEKSGALRERRRQRLMERVVDAVERRMHQRLWRDGEANEWIGSRIPQLESARDHALLGRR